MMLLGAIDWHSFFFFVFALLAAGFALGVVFTSNIVHMAFYLTLSLGATAGLFFLAGAEFVGAMQFMIYVGGTLVLLIFGVMLTAQSRFVHMKTSAGEWVLAAAVGSTLLVLLLHAAISNKSWTTGREHRDTLTIADAQHVTALGQSLSGVRPDSLEEPSPAARRGMSGYLLPFEIASIHLLVVLIGASYLARAKKRVSSSKS